MRILVLFGGESVEHEISIITANQVINALSVNYTVIPVYISKENKFYYTKNLMDLKSYGDIAKVTTNNNEIKICQKQKRYYIKRKGLKKNKYFDYAFIVVHGKGMEDGTLLSYLKFKKVPVIADNLSFYSLAQNKSLTKRVLNDLDIRNSKFMEIDRITSLKMSFPVIVKPNTLGSSIGIKKVDNEEDYNKAVEEALKYDDKVIVEEFLENCHEYNISVVEKKGEIQVSNIEEVIKDSEILNYSQKYEENNKLKGMASSKRIFPAQIDAKVKKEMEEKAIKIYKYFGAKGVIRIDFLFNDKLYVNEINSIPGSYAYYLWKDKMDFVELLDAVIDTSKRDIFKDKKRLKVIDKMDIFKNYNNKNGKLKV